MKQKILIFTMLFLYILSSITAFAASSTGTAIVGDLSDKKPTVSADGALLMDASSGEVLYSNNGTEKLYPASITKIVTAIVALQNAKLTDQITVSDNAVNGISADSSRLGLEVGEQISMEDALYGLMLSSGNDAAVAIAETVGGSVEGFCNMMNEWVASIGCTNSHFVNPHGLHDENHYTTPYDMALIMKNAIQNENFYTIASSKSHVIPATNLCESREIWNHHKMILNSDYHYDGVGAGKTGYTSNAGNTLVTTATRDNITLICVIMKGYGAPATYQDSTKLFNFGFENYKSIFPLKDYTASKLFDTNTTTESDTKEEYLSLEPAFYSDYSILVPKDLDTSALTMRVDFDRNDETKTLGKVCFSYNGEEIGSTPLTYTGTPKAAEQAKEETKDNSGTGQEKTTFHSFSFFNITIIAIIILLVVLVLILLKQLFTR